MVAEEVGEVLPDIVVYEEDGEYATGMDYSKLTPLLVEAIKSLKVEKDAEKAEKDAEIAVLKKQNRQLENRLASVESLLSSFSLQQMGDE